MGAISPYRYHCGETKKRRPEIKSKHKLPAIYRLHNKIARIAVVLMVILLVLCIVATAVR